MHWYHPHPHGISQMQLQRGMSGVISVGNVLGEVGYDSTAIAERFMLIRDFSYFSKPNPDSACWGPNVPFPLMNGQPLTHLTMRPGETQFWRIANVGSDRVYNLQLQGKKSGRIPMRVVARDGNAVAVEYDVDSIMLSPGNRWEVLVTAPAVTDTLQLWTPPLDRDSEGCTFPPQTFAYVTVGASQLLGAPRAMAFDAEGSDAQADTIRMLQSATAVQKFDVVFTRNSTGSQFLINGVAYDPTVTNKYVAIDSVQEWTVFNDDFDLHAFHIHQGDFLVVAQRDSGSTVWEPVPPNGRIDTIMIPRHGAVKIRFVYTDPRLAGMFVYHCHMLFHEDRGMMQNLCLYDPNSGKTPDQQCANPFASMGGAGGGGHGGHVMQ
jgi:FtsP/CotA-like multicopper oxidase with cupredoxin domain